MSYTAALRMGVKAVGVWEDVRDTRVLFAAAAGIQDHGAVLGGGGPSNVLREGAPEPLPVGIPLTQQPAPLHRKVRSRSNIGISYLGSCWSIDLPLSAAGVS